MRIPVTLCSFAAAFAMVNVGVVADTLTLKSGEKLEGKITAETAADVTMEVRVSAGITETRTVPKADVTAVEKDKPDDVAWQPLKNIKSGPNSLPKTAYDPLISALRGFITQHPDSPHVEEAKKALAPLEEERVRVTTGEVKLNGKWLSKAEVEKERYQINALLAFNQMRDQSTRNDLIGALNSFDLIDRQYPGSRVYPDAVELARKILGTLKSEVDRRMAALPREKADREKAIEMASEPKKSELRTMFQREDVAADAAIAASDQRQLRWPPLMAKHERSLSSLASRIPGEVQRLGTIDVAKQRQSFELADKARADLESKAFDSADQNTQKALGLWPQNEIAMRLQADIGAARAAAADAATAAAALPAPPLPTNAPAPADATAPPPETSQPATPSPVTASEAPTPAASTPPPAAADQLTPPAAEAARESEAAPAKPFLLRPIGAVTIVLAVLALIAAVKIYEWVKRPRTTNLEEW